MLATTRTSEREVALEGRSAAQWLGTLGTRVVSDVHALRAFGDVLPSDGLTLARIWHSGREVVRTAPAGTVAVLLVVEGDLVVRGDGIDATVVPGGGLVQPGSAPLALSSEGRTGIIEITLDDAFVRRYWVEPAPASAMIPQSLRASRILLTTATATFAAGLDEDSAGWTYVAGMIENGVSAILAELEPRYLRHASANATRLLRRAHTLILRRHRDPDFSPRALALELSVSTSGLYSAFSETGATPAGAIRSARAATAQALLARRRGPSQVDLDEIAALAGFATTPKMLSALRDG